MFLDVSIDMTDLRPGIDEPAPETKPARANPDPEQAAARKLRAVQVAAVAKTLQIAAAEADQRSSLAALLNVSDPDDIRTLTVAALTAGSTAGRPIGDVDEVATSAPMDAVLTAIALTETPDRFKAAWSALNAISPLGRMPANPVKAAGVFARAAQELDGQQRAQLAAPLQLIG